MKKIFIAIHYMKIGGAERALLGLLNSFDTKEYNIDLFIYYHNGEFMNLIPKKINILPENRAYSMIEKPIKEVIISGFIKIAIARLLGKFRTFIYKLSHPSFNETSTDSFIGKFVSLVLPNIPGKYDLAISFLTPHNYVLDHVKALKKIAWIHTDYRSMHVNRKHDLKIWGQYDYIASISDDVTLSFISVFPELKNKIILIKNILSPSSIREQAKMKVVKNEMPNEINIIRILTVGRFTSQKNFDNIPDICHRINKILKDQNLKNKYQVKWYIIGYGPDENLIKAKIVESKEMNSVKILGKKINPYPYIQECDIYVQPSRYEGNCVAVREAQILGKPVIITNYVTATSQIKNGKDGIIVDLDNQSCAEGIVKFINDKDIQNKIISNCKLANFGNEEEVQKIYEIINKK